MEFNTASKEESAKLAEKFRQIRPSFSFSLNGEVITVRISPVEDAQIYEVYTADKARGEYVCVSKSASPVHEFRLPGKSECCCKVRACREEQTEKADTRFSAIQKIDLVIAEKKRKEKISRFFDVLKEIGTVLSFEDLDIATESLKVAGLEAQEKERRRKLEEEAERNKKLLETQRKRREAAAKRAAARREKKRLEHVANVTRMDLPLDFVNAYSEDERASVQCDSIEDGLVMSLEMLGMVDIEFIASVTGEEMRKIIEELRGTIFQNPLYWNEVFYKGWETADEYLSGNILHKYQVAKRENERYNGYFQSNVTALEGVMDAELATDEIYISLGSPWIPADVIDEFIAFLAFGGNYASKEAQEYCSMCQNEEYAVRHDDYTGVWEIPNRTRFRASKYHGMFEEVNYKIYGTERADMLWILENALNMKTLTITDSARPWDLNCKTRILNQEETVKALEKQQYMNEVFQKWVWEDEDRKERLKTAYCRKYGNVKKRVFDGSFLSFPGMSDKISLYDYQKNAVARILFSPNTLLAHDVGSGKTYTMVAAGMELRRLGKSKKNLYVVPNSIIGQWESMFRMMYPEAKVLTVTHSNFDPKRRPGTLMQIKTGDYDAILMTYSCFDMLPLSDRYYIDLYKERKKILERATSAFYSSKEYSVRESVINRALDKLQQSYEKNGTKDITFDQLGINTLFLDEAHNYKNVSIQSRITRARGIGNAGSARCNQMMDKVHCVQRMNDGGRIVFATATPVTNSLSDIYVMQRYLQDGELEFQGLHSFDAWAGMYAEKTTGFEIDLDTNSYHLVTRFSRFCNIPELTATLSSVADFHRLGRESGIPELEGYTNSLADGSEDFRDYLKEISNRADVIRQKKVSPKVDNMLKITTDGRKAALDMRLIDVAFGRDGDAKVVRCAENAFEVYESTRDVKGTQLIFCDSSTPKDGFNLYGELKEMLVAMGIPEKEIAFVHDAQTDSQRKKLFDAVREGEIAILIGSTMKMGHGMNVQKHLVALHHLDVPWRPADMVQREGRILRQGNENERIRIFRYVTRASFDAYSWQLLETKQRFINQILSGSATAREGSDIDDTVLSYAEVKALAVGNPKIKRRVELCNELDRYRILHKAYVEGKAKNRQLAATLPLEIAEQRDKIEKCRMDIEAYREEKTDYNAMKYEEQKALRAAIYQAVKMNVNKPVETEILTYQGFKVVVPAHMIPKPRKNDTGDTADTWKTSNIYKPLPYVYLVKNGSYFMDIESEQGITKRLSNCLENLDKQKEKYETKLHQLEQRLKTVQEELKDETGNYTGRIRELENEIRQINEELGVAS